MRKTFCVLSTISIFAFLQIRRDGRVVECGGLENHCAAMYRGFESLSLRKKALEISRAFYLYLYIMKKINADITKATTLEGKFYNCEREFKDTIENVFAYNWQFICDDSKLKENKNAVPFQFLAETLPEPLVLINNVLANKPGWFFPIPTYIMLFITSVCKTNNGSSCPPTLNPFLWPIVK